LDVYLPKGKKDFATLVWFHGGGLKIGDKGSRKSGDSGGTALLATSFAEIGIAEIGIAEIGIAVIGIAVIGIAVVVPNYRLSPEATFPAYIQDAAAAVV